MGQITPIVNQSALGKDVMFHCCAFTELCLELLLVLKVNHRTQQ